MEQRRRLANAFAMKRTAEASVGRRAVIEFVFYNTLNATVLGGCALGMQGVDPNWDGKQEPQCADSYELVVVDGMVATGVSALVSDSVKTEAHSDHVHLLGAAIAFAYAISATLGAGTYTECRQARAEWHVREALRESKERRSADPRPPSSEILPAARSSPVQGVPMAPDSSRPSFGGSPQPLVSPEVSPVPPGSLQ
jgi:hypothetical protein